MTEEQDPADKPALLHREEPTTPDLVKRFHDALRAADRRDFDAAMSVYAGDTVFDSSEAGLGIFEGRPAVRSFLEEWIGMYEEYESGIEDVRDLGNGVVFAVFVLNGRLPGSGGLLHQRYGLVTIWTDGLIERTINITDIGEARAAAERLAEERG